MDKPEQEVEMPGNSDFTKKLYQIADKFEDELHDEHGSFDEHYNVNENCSNFDRVEWLRDTAAKVDQGVIVLE